MSSSASPLITVITVVRNGEAVIEDCIKSVFAQNTPNLEYIVIEGASTDRTLEIIKRYQDKITKIVSEPDKGLYDAMNKGLANASGKYIHFLNADDRYFNDQVLAEILPKLDESTVCYGQMKYIDMDGQASLLGQPFDWHAELRGSRVPQMALIVPRHCYATVGKFDLSLRIAADYDMVLRLAKQFPIKHIEIPISIMHAGGISYQRPDLAFRESMLVARRYGRSILASRWDFALKHLKWFVARRLSGKWLNLLKRKPACQ